MNKVYPTNRALNMLPEYKSIFIGKFLFLWNNTLYINTVSIFHRAKVNKQSFPFSFPISLLFLKLLCTEPVGVKSSFTSDHDMLLYVFIFLVFVFIHSQINIIKALALAWLVAPVQFMGLMKINVGQKPHIIAIFMGLNQNCHKVRHGINPGFTKSKMKKISSPWR